MQDDRWHWDVSCALNARLGGDPDEPLCSRVFRQPRTIWRACYVALMVPLLGERGHCGRVFADWLEGR